MRHFGRNHLVFSGVAALCGFTAFAAAADEQQKKPVVVRAAVLHVGNGETIENGMVLIEGDRIAAIGAELKIPDGAEVIELKDGSITPGLIDANADVTPTNLMVVDSRDARQVLREMFESHEGHGHEGHKHGPGIDCCGSSCPLSMHHVEGQKCAVCGFPDTAPAFAVGTRFDFGRVESSSEVIPHTRVIDSVNLGSPDFERLLRDGVTTVYVAPDPSAVISSQGAIVRTGGPLGERIVEEAKGVTAAMGTDPSWRGPSNRRPFRSNVNFYARRPTTRMGVAWVFRKAMYDTRTDEQGLPLHGADQPSEQAMGVLREVLAGEVPLRIQARMQHDILTAMRLAKEFNLSFTLIEGTESYKCTSELKEAGTPVVFGPIYVNAPGMRAGTLEVDENRLHTFKSLLDAGVTTALTAHELRDEDGLSRQAMYARRVGVPMAEVTKAVTATPAAILGLADVGTLEVGKRADLVLWSGEPFDGASKPVTVMIGGEVVHSARKAKSRA